MFLTIGASNSPGQPNSVKRKKLPVDSVFNKFEDEDSDDVPRKRKLVPLDYGEDDKNATKGTVNTEEKRKHIKSLIEKIPTAKPELFAYPLDWSIVDSVSSTLFVTIFGLVFNVSDIRSYLILVVTKKLEKISCMMNCQYVDAMAEVFFISFIKSHHTTRLRDSHSV